MGARPIAVMDSIRFGPLDDPKTGGRNHRILEGVRGSGESGNGVGALEQARHAALLARPVLQPAFVDQRGGHGGGDGPMGPERRRAKDAHGMVVGEHQVAERGLADRTDDVNPALRHGWGRPRLDRQDAIGADHAADVGVALGGIGVDAIRQLLERGLLLPQVRRGSKRLPADTAHHPIIGRQSHGRPR